MPVEVYSDLREVIDKRGVDGARPAGGPEKGANAQPPAMAAALPAHHAPAADRPSTDKPGARLAAQSKPTGATSSPSDLLSPCSEALLRRRFRVPKGTGSSLERSLADVSLAGPPRPSLRDSLPASALPAPIADGSVLAAVDAELSIRSPLASLGTPSNANTPRARAARSFGTGTTPKDKSAAPRALEQQRSLPASSSAMQPPPIVDAEEDCEPSDENATAIKPSADELRSKFARLQAMDTDGTVLRLLQGDVSARHEEMAPPSDDDGFFVLPDEPSAEPRAAEGEATAEGGVSTPLKMEPSGFGAGAFVGTAALATTVGVAVCVGLRLQRRGN